MKTIISTEKELGGDGAQVKAALGVEAANLKVEVAVTYPIEKVLEPATTALNDALDKLEKLIPGDWDKPLIEKVKVEFKEKLVALLAE